MGIFKVTNAISPSLYQLYLWMKPLPLIDQPSVVAASLIQTLSWKDRKAKFIIEAEPPVMDEVLYRIIPLIGADRLFQDSE